MPELPNDSTITQNQRDQVITFISYAREDERFAHRLDETLRLKGIEVRADWQLVRGEGFSEQLRLFIRESDVFIFVISPEAVNSVHCRREMTIADEMKKRVLPVVYRDHGSDDALHPALREPQWTFLREEDDFVAEIQKLIEAVNTDFELMPEHRRLLAAAETWDKSGRSPSYLLRKEGLKKAQDWLEKTSLQPTKLPKPTGLQSEYLLASQQNRNRSLQTAFAVVLGLVLLLSGLTVFAFIQRGNAQSNAEKATEQQKIAEQNANLAQEQEKKATDNAAEAERQKQQAEDNLAEAQRQKAIAEANEREANKNAAEARRQQKTAEDNARRAVEVGKRRLLVATLLLNPEGTSFTTLYSYNGDLNFGLLPWSSKLGNLKNILSQFQSKKPELFMQIFGEGDPLLAQKLIDYVGVSTESKTFLEDELSAEDEHSEDNEAVEDEAQPEKQVNKTKKTDETEFWSPEGKFNEPWFSRFKKAGENPAFQAVQLEEFTDQYLDFINELKRFAPEIRSERGVAFMLDVAFHMSKNNARKFFLKAKENSPNATEAELLRQVAEQSMEHVKKSPYSSKFYRQFYERRQKFLTTPYFSDKALGF